MKKINIFTLLLFTIISFSNFAKCQVEDVDAVTGLIEDVYKEKVDLTDLSKKLQDIENSIKNQQILNDSIDLTSFFADNETLLLNLKKQFEREESFIQKKIDALGEEPKDNGEELEIITQRRKEFAQEMALQKAKIAEVNILLAKISEVGILVVNEHNRILIGNLMTKMPSLLNPQNFYKSFQLASDFILNIAKSPAQWIIKGNHQNITKDIYLSLVIIACIVFLGFILRQYILKNFGYKTNLEQAPNYEEKLKTAICVAAARGLIPSLFLAGMLLWFLIIKSSEKLFFDIVIINILHYSLYIVIGMALSRVIFAPKYPQWRLANISDKKAKKFNHAVYLSIFLVSFCLCMENIATQANYQINLLYLLSLLSTSAKCLSLIMIVNATFWQEDTKDDDNADDTSDDATFSINWKINFFAILLSLTLFGLAVFGYFKLPEFILNRMILSIILVFSFSTVKNILFDLSKHAIAVLMAHSRKKLRNKVLENIDIFISIFLTPVLWVIMGVFLLNLWGIPSDWLIQAIKKLFFGFHVGNLRISLISILLGIASFFLILYLFKLLSSKLKQNLLSKINIEDGIRNSLLTTLHFFGSIIAALIAIVIMGIDLTNLALIAGALSIGIGFGLQNIINNLVSGLIILFERPFNVGDWVMINGEEGRIKQVNIRSTVVETFNKSNIIIPNANLLSSSVTNLTHDNNSARYGIKVGVAYGSDIQKVKDILLECAKTNKYVVKNPAPYVIFQDFGNSSLDFELRFYVNDIWEGWVAPSDIRFEINKRFQEENIEIPFPQIVVHNKKEQ